MKPLPLFAANRGNLGALQQLQQLFLPCIVVFTFRTPVEMARKIPGYGVLEIGGDKNVTVFAELPAIHTLPAMFHGNRTDGQTLNLFSTIRCITMERMFIFLVETAGYSLKTLFFNDLFSKKRVTDIV